MINKENNIEQIFKEAFEDFTPDVSPKVWSGVSEQIANSPVAPVSQIPASVVKTVATQWSTVGMWIIGGIAVTAIIAGIAMYGNQQTSDKSSTTLVTSTEFVESTKDKTLASEPIPTLITTNEKTTEADKTMLTEKDLTNTIIRNNVPEEKQISNESVSVVPEKQESKTEKQNTITSITTSNSTSQKENRKQEEPTQVEGPTNNNSVADKPAPVLILINTTAGFAPLQVACLLNKENLNADWDFGDGSTQKSSTNVTHKYLKAGTYTLQCTTSETTLTKTIEVIGEMITVFSPNGDGINDYFYVDASMLLNYSLRIVDRNGRKVIDLKELNEKWDGNNANGQAAEAGTYFYELNALTESGKEIKQRGTVNLFR